MSDHKTTNGVFSVGSFGIDPFRDSDYFYQTVRVFPLLVQFAFACSFCGSLVSAPIVADDFEHVILSNDWDNPVENTSATIGAETNDPQNEQANAN